MPSADGGRRTRLGGAARAKPAAPSTRANADLTAETAGAASLAVAASRASSTAVSVEVASRLFEVAGTRSALDSLNLNRHWRNARTHTLHDPAAWKVQHLGRWVVDRHAAAQPRTALSGLEELVTMKAP